MGAAMERGIKVSPATSVYATMGVRSDTLDARKSAMTDDVSARLERSALLE